MEGGAIRARGLICAGGEATRLQELTRITNKHLLPVGRWPMVYYPLQLMQLLGIRDVLLVTGQGHAGDFIDLLGDGRVQERDGDGLLFDLDLTYKVQTEPGGIAQVVGMAESFAAGASLVVCLGDNIFEHAEGGAVGAWASDPGGALIFVKDVPDPERFGVVVYGEDGGVTDVVEKAGVVDTRLKPSSRGELEITDVNRWYAEQGRLRSARVSGWWRDAGTHEALGQIGNLIDETGVNKPA
jgi:glucose-1-phosphate thymidylyltransferase